jgi:hypothetical protein
MVRVLGRNLHSGMLLVPTPAPLEASRRATNGVPLGWRLFLPVHTVNFVQTLKAQRKQHTSKAGGSEAAATRLNRLLQLINSATAARTSAAGTAPLFCMKLLTFALLKWVLFSSDARLT